MNFIKIQFKKKVFRKSLLVHKITQTYFSSFKITYPFKMFFVYSKYNVVVINNFSFNEKVTKLLIYIKIILNVPVTK